MRILYVCPYKETTGYGFASRGNIDALEKMGHEIIVSSDMFKNHGVTVPKRFIKKEGVVDFAFYHLPVEWLPNLYVKGIPSAVYTTFETNKFPERWVNILNGYKIKYVCVPSKYNKDALINSGYQGKVFIIPHPLDVTQYAEDKSSLIEKRLPDYIKKDNPYIFYSIFQWSERKNPIALLTSYFMAFQNNENVLLLLKTHLTGRDDYRKISEWTVKTRDKIGLINPPKVCLITQRLTQEEIEGLHDFCDCYVSAHRAEGAGVPIMEAMAKNNPVICSHYSGSLEFANEKTAYTIPCRETFCIGQDYFTDWKLQYQPNMIWGDIDIIEFSNEMKKIFDNKKHNKKEMAFKNLKKNHSFEAIGKKFNEVLNEYTNNNANL